jgi:signal transduction histidine kinase
MINNKKWSFIILLVVLVGASLVIFYDDVGLGKEEQPFTRQGYLDLSDWDFLKDGNVKLDGDWEFYWDQLLGPEDLGKKNARTPDGYLKVPSAWRGMVGDVTLLDKGVGTYRLRVKLPDAQIRMGIKTTSIRMSSRIFIDGVEVSASGNPATSQAAGYLIGNTAYAAYFTPQDREIEIIIQVADLDYRAGGIVQSIYIGRQMEITALTLRRIFLDCLLIASLFMNGVYHLFIFAGRKRDISTMYYGLYAVALALFLLLYGEKILLQVFAGLAEHYYILVKIQNVLLYITIMLVCLFAKSVADRTVPDWFVKSVVVFFSCSSVAFVLLPLDMAAILQDFSLLGGMAAYVFVIGALLIAIYRKQYDKLNKNEMLYLTAGFACVLIFFLDGTFYLNNMKNDNYLGYLAMFLFILIISALLSHQYNNSFKAMEKMSVELQTLDKLKDEFLTNTSHELRTPLNGIINITSSVIDSGENKLDLKQRQDLQVVVAAARRLYNLINDILDISCFHHGEIKLSKRSVDLRSAVELTMYVLNRLKEDKDIEFVNSIPEDLPPVLADVERLRQILYNLIGNALKFTQQGKIEVGASIRQGKAEIWVADTGCGIPEDKLGDIFRSFYQIDSSLVRSASGTGLGLSITKTLVELHGGQIKAISDEAQGSKFIFTLPLSKVDEVDIHYEIINSFEGGDNVAGLSTFLETEKRQYSVLIADDDPASLTALFNILDNEGYYVKAFTNGAALLTELEHQGGYDLVILDIMMPKLSGFEVLQKIRTRFLPMDLPVLLLTAKARPEDLQSGFDAGANDYIAKPFEALELKSRVKTLVQLKGSVSSKVETELSFLQAQIKPHFLYNTLGVIAALSTKEPERAKELIYDLSDYLRGSFNFENFAGLTPLESELATVKAYVAIERARFKDVLNVEYEIDATIDVSVPMLVIQPLVENAIRHGVIKKNGGGTVWLSIKTIQDDVVISVEDDGVGIPPEKLAEIVQYDAKMVGGVGLKNIQRRMMLYYGQGLTVDSQEGRGTIVSMTIPKKNKGGDS